MIKDTDEQPDDDMHRVKSARVLSTGVSVPVESGWVWISLPTWKLSKPNTTGIFMDYSSHIHEQSLIPFLVPLFSLEIV